MEGYLDVPSLKSQLEPNLYNNRVKMTADLTVSNKDNLKVNGMIKDYSMIQGVCNIS